MRDPVAPRSTSRAASSAGSARITSSAVTPLRAATSSALAYRRAGSPSNTARAPGSSRSSSARTSVTGPHHAPRSLAHRPDHRQDVVRGGHQQGRMGLPAQQFVTSDRHAGGHRSGHRHQRPAERDGMSCGVGRAGPSRRLDDHHAGGQRGDQPIPGEEPPALRSASGRALRHQQPGLGDGLEQAGVARRVRPVEPAGRDEHRGRRSLPARRDARRRRSRTRRRRRRRRPGRRARRPNSVVTCVP